VGKLVLIDGNAILHRAFHALPPLTTKTGEPINAVYGLVSMLLKTVQDLKPTHLAVCFDEKEPTFRHKAFSGYQAQRPHMADELSGQFEKARKFLDAAGIAAYSKPGYEADDVIGTLSKLFKDEVVIVTGDRDILQLVDNRVKVYMPIAGLSSARLMGEAEVVEKMGIPPSQIDDYKAFVGDSSDNYSGVSGIGPKTALSLLKKYGSMKEAYKHLKDLPPQTSQRLERGRQQAALSKKLATIVRDVPLKFNQEETSHWDVDSLKVLNLFQDFGFKTLTERVKKVGKLLDTEKQASLF
jgi:DNA polymerase-1